MVFATSPLNYNSCILLETTATEVGKGLWEKGRRPHTVFKIVELVPKG